MKSTILAAIVAMTAIPAFAGPTENITGCATVAVEGTNYTVKADPSCVIASTKGGDSTLMVVLTKLVEEF